MAKQTNPTPSKGKQPRLVAPGTVAAATAAPAPVVTSAPAQPPVQAPTPSAPASPFAAFVAQQQKANGAAAAAALQTAARVTMPATGTAVQLAAKAGFTRTVQNGRGDYTPNSIGALIWQTATALQALTPNTPVGAAAVRAALPHIKPASVSAGLSHWRKFNGTMRVKGQPRTTAPVQATPSAAALAWVP